MSSSASPMPERHRHGPRFESLAVFATVLRSPSILRVQLAFLLFNTTEIAAWIAILVYAYDQGGTNAAGLVAFAPARPGRRVRPDRAALGDRIPRIRMLALAYAVYALLTLLAAAAFLAVDADPLVVYAAVVVSGLALTLVRPAHAAVLPTIARTPSELTAANVASGTVENIGVLVGSVGGGVLLAATGPAGVFLVAGIGLLLGFLAIVGMRPVWPPSGAARRADARRRRPRALGPRARRAGRGAGRGGGPRGQPRRHHGDRRRAVRRAALIGADPHTRVVVLMLGLSMMLVGILDVLGVVLALEVLDAGEQGVGLSPGRSAPAGCSGRHRDQPRRSSPAARADADRRRGHRPRDRDRRALPVLGVVLVGFLAGGVGKSVFDVAGRTMLQRVAPDATLTRVFGVLEGVTMAALALGTLAAPVLVQLSGRCALAVAAGSSRS